MKKVFGPFLLSVLLLAAGQTVCAQTAAGAGGTPGGLSGFFEGAEPQQPMNPQTYELGVDVLASLPAIVGHRDCVESGAGSGGMQEYTYRSDTVRDDLLAYIDYLGEQGFEVVRGASLEAPGAGELLGPSKEAGGQIHLALDWTQDSYHLRFTRTGGGQSAAHAGRADPAVEAQGQALLDAESDEEALALYEDALAKAPDVAAYHGGRGEALVGLGRYQEALEALDTAIGLDATVWAYFNERGVAYYFLGRPGDAMVDFEEAVALQPDTDDAHYNLAYVQLELGEAQNAADTCMAGLHSFPDSSDLWLLQGDAGFALRAYDDALICYDQAISRGGITDKDIEHYAEAKEKAGAPKPTIEPQPVPGGPTEADPALLRQCTTLINEGSIDEALALFDAAIARQPGVAAYHYGRSQALRADNRQEEARAAVREAIRLDPQNWAYHNELADMLWGADREEEALVEYRIAIGLNPPVDDAHFNLAYVYYQMNLLEESAQVCAEGLALFPESEWLWWQMADAQYALGNYEEAVTAYEKLFAYSDYSPEDFEDYATAKANLEETSNTGAPATQPPKATGGEEASRLQNYEDWIRPYVDVMPYQGSMLDGFLESTDLGDGLVQEAVEYPSGWPSQWLDGTIPEYTGTGWMFDMYVVHPNMSYAAEDVRCVEVTVYAYDQAELDAYIAGLAAYGLREAEAPVYDLAWIQSVRTFRNDQCFLNVLTGEGPGADFKILQPGQDGEAPEPFVQFSVTFLRDPYMPDTGLTERTDLLNYEQWNDLVGKPADQRAALDQLAESYTDEYGRLNEMIFYPAQWPKDVFGELIPEFTLPGIMYYMVITMPADTPSRDQALIATMCVTGGFPEYVEQYAQEIKAFGYREVPVEEYTEQEAAGMAGCESYRIFSLPCMRCLVATENRDGTSVLQITLRWNGRYNNFLPR